MNMLEIGEAIRQARREQQLSQAELGERLVLKDNPYLQDALACSYDVGVRKLMALCAALGLELSVGPRRAYPTLQELRQENHASKRS